MLITALAIAREIGDRSAEAQFLIAIGDFYGAQGEHSQALDSYQQALVIAREQGDRQAEETILSNIGFIDFLIFIEEGNRSPEPNP
ncbi:MAG: tetratricopeptide repeat-containing protein [Leptolyngbyaceae cyanobacterium SM1_3_5]|nr:tetratricopeptide repeat-containing protein [Leptolyngbyaceae cyanobacterium SM1_3_5]